MPTLLCCPSDDTRQCGHHCCLSGTLLWLDPRAGGQTHLSTPLQPLGLESGSLHPLPVVMSGSWGLGFWDSIAGGADSRRGEGRGESLHFSRGPEFHQRLHL